MQKFNKLNLQTPANYYKGQGLRLVGGGEWKSATCPFHSEHRPSLRIRIDSGGFRCMSCNVHGGDIVDFHRQRYGLGFIAAAKQLGAWRYV